MGRRPSKRREPVLRPVSKEMLPLFALGSKSKKRKSKTSAGKKPSKKPRRKYSRMLQEFLAEHEPDIIKKFNQGVSIAEITRWLREEGGAKTEKLSDSVVGNFIKQLIADGKLKAREGPPKKIKPQIKSKEPLSQETLLKLNPHQKKIIDWVNQGESFPSMALWLSKRGTFVSAPTIKKYVQWILKKKEKK